jgi:hypothetical protein
MSKISNVSKLAELRARTDRQLIQIINSELERGLQFALQAAETKSAYHFGVTKLHDAEAEKACAYALNLVSKVDDINERLRLESKLHRLRAALDGQRHLMTASF